MANYTFKKSDGTSITTKVSQIDWPHYFLLSAESYHDIPGLRTLLAEWCAENCNGQYMMSDGSSDFTCYVKPAVENPFNVLYKPSSVRSNNSLFIAFEKEEDATAFKLNFS